MYASEHRRISFGPSRASTTAKIAWRPSPAGAVIPNLRQNEKRGWHPTISFQWAYVQSASDPQIRCMMSVLLSGSAGAFGIGRIRDRNGGGVLTPLAASHRRLRVRMGEAGLVSRFKNGPYITFG